MQTIRNTKQKEYVLNNLKNRYDHPSAKQIATDAANGSVSIGTTSVYRILNGLVEEGKINKIVTKDNVTHYDYDRQDHIHLVCNHCGKIFDLNPQEVFKDANILSKHDFNIQLQDVTLYGTCANCKTATKQKKYQNN